MDVDGASTGLVIERTRLVMDGTIFVIGRLCFVMEKNMSSGKVLIHRL